MKLLTFSFLFIVSTLLGNEIGQYPSESFRGANGESFKSNIVTADQYGNIYTGTDAGVKVFKGGAWENIYTSSREVTHLVYDYAGNLLIGGDNYFGVLEQDSLANFRLDEVSESLSTDIPFKQLHRIIEYNDGSFLHIDNKIVKLNDRLIDYNFEDVTYAGAFNRNVIIQRLNEGLFIYAGNDFRKINASDEFGRVEISNIVDLKDGTFILLYDDKAVHYDGDNFKKIRIQGLGNQEISSVIANEEGLFLYTLDQGILQYSLNDWSLLKSLPFDGWCNNLFSDENSNIWISSNDGVTVLKTKSPFRMIPFGDEIGRSIHIVKDQLYLGTNRGTYSTNINKFIGPDGERSFRQISSEYVNSLSSAEEKLLVASKNSPDFGNNINQLFYSEENGILIKADKSGLGFYEKEYSRWVFGNHIYGLEEEVKLLVKDSDGNFWAHAARSGITLLNFDPVLNTISPEIFEMGGIRPDHINGIFLINGSPIVTTQYGVYEFVAESRSFQLSAKYNDLFGSNNSLIYVHQDNAEDIWYISEVECGILRIEDNGIQKSAEKIRIPELSSYVNTAHPSINSIGPDHIIFNGNDGFITVQKSKVSKQQDLELSLHRIKFVTSGREIFIPFQDQEETYEVTREDSELILSFGSSQDIHKDVIWYSYKLNDREWSDWKDEHSIQLSFPGGLNSLQVRAKSGLNSSSKVSRLAFFVKQEWYYETWVYYLAGAIGIFLGILLLYYVKYLLGKRNLRINDLLQENRDQKRQIRELSDKNEVLGAQLISVMSESDIHSQLRKISEEYENPEVKKAVKKLSKKIKTERKDSEGLIMIDPDFTSMLKLKYPSLTKKDIKLCSLLKMDLTTKEIAPMLDISVRGVEISRYRLRKKLALNNEVVLSDFLKNL
jgi:DNA-binding CsgD family transcriptional regulator